MYDWMRYVPKGDKHVCHAKLKERCKRPPCADVPLGYVVQAHYGFCERLRHHTGRSCRYMTLLRDPVERLLSDWNYYCLACQENNKECPTHRQEAVRDEYILNNSRLPRDVYGVPMVTPLNSCPQMTAVDYAAYRGNPYTEQFGVDVSKINDKCDEPDASRWPSLRPSLERAQEALRRSDMMVIFTEDLSHDGLAPLWRSLNESAHLMEELAQAGHRNGFTHQAKPTVNETRALQLVLSADVQLFNSVRTHEHRRRALASVARSGYRGYAFEAQSER